MKKLYLNRRKFLLLLAAAALGSVKLFTKNAYSANPDSLQDTGGNTSSDAERIILLKQILQRQLPYVVIEQQTLEIFYQDLSRSGDRFESLLIVENRLREQPRLLQASIPDPVIKFYGANLAREFLLSTSFFYDRKMRYLGLYSPYTRPCQNPFANLG